jgi:hypothetical protein
MSGIKIKLVTMNGEERVPPKCMELLKQFAQHRDSCRECFRAFHAKNPYGYCPTGTGILKELAAQPEVEPLPKEDAP